MQSVGVGTVSQGWGVSGRAGGCGVRLLQRSSARPRYLWYDRSTAPRSALPRQQPRATHRAAQRLFKATSGYQLLPPVMCDHKEGCAPGARLPATRQRARGCCHHLGQSGRPGGARRPPRAACMHWDLPACLPAARGGARRAAWHALGFACMHESCWLAVTLSQITVKVSQLRLRSAEA